MNLKKMREVIIHRGQEIALEIPESYGELESLKMKLEAEHSLLLEALGIKQTKKQKQRLKNHEIEALRAKIKVVNMALYRLKYGGDNRRKRPPNKLISRKYQELLLSLKTEEFPEKGTDKEQLKWAVAQWQKAMQLLLNKDLTSQEKKDLKQEVKIQFSVVSAYLKEEIAEVELESDKAKEILNIPSEIR